MHICEGGGGGESTGNKCNLHFHDPFLTMSKYMNRNFLLTYSFLLEFCDIPNHDITLFTCDSQFLSLVKVLHQIRKQEINIQNVQYITRHPLKELSGMSHDAYQEEDAIMRSGGMMLIHNRAEK